MKITDTQPPTIFCNFSNDFFTNIFTKYLFVVFSKLKTRKNIFISSGRYEYIYITKKLIAKKLSGEFQTEGWP